MNLESIDKASNTYKTFIFLEFTRQILKNTRRYKTKIAEDILKGKVDKIIEKNISTPSEKINLEVPIPVPPERMIKIPKLKKPKFFSSFSAKITPFKRAIMPRIPPLPPTVRNIKPIPQYAEINLNKLEPLARDPTVNAIICNGPGQNVVVRRGSEKRTTAVILSVEEMDEIVENFASDSKIPIEDFYKVVVGNLELNAIDPKGESPKFIINKIPPRVPFDQLRTI